MSIVTVTQLRCEYLVNPLGIDERTPRLSWQLESSSRGTRQLAYRIRVASTMENLTSGAADRWDSGRIESAQTTHIVYAGAPLHSRDLCYWAVEVWATSTAPAVQSIPSLFTIGLLEKADWSATWITADPTIITRDPAATSGTLINPGTPAIFRREFALTVAPQRATLYATARGIIELKIGGRRVTEDLFAPEWTDYDKRIHYRTYDVTALLSAGSNTLSATLGDGWWSGYVGWQETRARYGSLENSLLLQLEIELTDGSRLTVGTDGNWQCATGPILSSDFMMGETYDARRESRISLPPVAGVAAPDSASSALSTLNSQLSTFPSASPWLPARTVSAPAVPLVAQRSEPVRICENLVPVSLNQVTPGVFIYDLGQNISGWVQLRLPTLPAGTRVTIRHGERLNPDGTLYTENLRRAKATDVYVTRGAANETYEPHFTFHGFQYVELTATAPSDTCHLLSDKFSPSLGAVTGRVIHSATPPAGHFECSHAGVNRLWRNGLWSQKDNFLSVPTDCPQRDERLGWMGDAQVFLRTASYNMDVAGFFTKWMIDVEDAQTPEGIFPDVAPRLREGDNFIGLGGLGGAAGWADAGVIIPYTIWQVYGDRRILTRHYTAMVKWVDWIAAHNPSGLRLNELANNYGDWLCLPSDTSFGTHSPMKNLLATAYWADDCSKLARIARELGHTADAQRFESMFELVRAAFQKEWLLPDGELSVDTQTATLLALAFDLLPPEVRSRAAERLVANITALDCHLSTGFIGISHLNPQLTLTGHADTAYKLLLQDTYPSWLYPVNHGATTIWERWNGWTEKDGFFNPQMNSFNHYSLGSVGEWLFRHVAGIELDAASPGFQNFILRPYLGVGLDHARATYRTLHGEILSHWQRTGDEVTWKVCVPANCTAQIYIPSESATPIATDGLTITGRDGRFALCLAPAGTYEFKSTFRV